MLRGITYLRRRPCRLEDCRRPPREAVTLEDAYEPYLLQIGFLNVPASRLRERAAYEHLGISCPEPVKDTENTPIQWMIG